MISAAIKPKTRNAYESGMRSVMKFLLSATTPLSPDIAFKDPLFWALYIVHMADIGRTPETARHYISGCQTLFAEVGEQIRPLRWPIVRRTLKGFYNKWIPPPKSKKQPITVTLLNRLRDSFNLSIHADRVTWAMACVATYGLMRCGEIAADSLCDSTFLTLADLDFNDEKSIARIFLVSSKSDTKHMGVSIYLATNNSPSCPVAALLSLLTSSRPKSPSSPLFSYDFVKPASRAQFISRFKKKLSLIVNDVKSFSGHSFRRGGAQSLFDAGLEISDIQTLGRWRTDLVARRYFGMTKDRLCEISKLMTTTASSRPLQFESLKPATNTLPVVSTLFGRVRKEFGDTSRF
jgi:hypothetical protein